MNDDKAVFLNMIANVIGFMVTLFISFMLTPYITKNVGIEAYGLVGLANSFVGYLTILTAAVNSMASRFIIIEIHKGLDYKANIYYTSTLYANLVFAIMLSIPALLLICNIEILNISPSLIIDAQLTFALIAMSFIINLIFSRYGIVLYAKNILWKGSLRNIESNIIRVLLIFLFFYIFKPQIYYVVAATFISGIYPILFNYYYSRKLLPNLRVKKCFYSFKALMELVSSAIWNSLTRLSQVLLDGLDLLLTNIFINGTMTGNISIAKTIPMLYTSVVAMLSDSFYPKFLEYYSQKKSQLLLAEIKKSISVLSAISGICLSLLIVYAKEFYHLWVPGIDAILLRNITYCAVGTVLISGCVYSLYYVFSLTNKIKINSLVLLATGVLSIVTTFLCLKFTDLGAYAIVGVSSVYGVMRNLTFTPIYAAKCLDLKWYVFYPTIFKNLMNILILICGYSLIKTIIPVTSWSLLVCNGLLDIIIGLFLTLFIMYNREERDAVLKILRIKK